MKNNIFRTVLLVMIFGIGVSCRNVSDIKAFTEAKYTLDRVADLQVNGINVSEKSRLEDFSFQDMAQLYSAFNQNALLANGVLGLQVEMPSKGNREITVTQLKWQLLVDDQETLSGMVDQPVVLKEGMNMIPVQTPLLVTETNGQRNFQGLMQLATMLSQKGEERGNIVVRIRPTVKTSIGPVEAPNFITVYQPKKPI